MKKIALALAVLAPSLAPSLVLGQDHVTIGRRMVRDILPANNIYSTSAPEISESLISGVKTVINRSVCSSYTYMVLQQAYGLTAAQIASEFGGDSTPNAARWYDTLALAPTNPTSFFDRMDEGVTGIQVGDFIAIRYPAGESATGHVMVFDSLPVLSTATTPIIANTVQYRVDIIDSTSAPHGSSDTRSPSSDTGVGRGKIRLYYGTDGYYKGFTWSTSSSSTYRPIATYPAVIARYIP